MINRRETLRLLAAAGLGLAGCTSTPRRKEAAAPDKADNAAAPREDDAKCGAARIRGTLWWPGTSLTAPQLIDEIDAQQRAGFDLIWLCGSQYMFATPAGRDLIKAVFNEADARGMKVMFQTYTSSDWYSAWNLAEEADRNFRFMRLVNEFYGKHPSLAYWYIGHEIYLAWDAQADYCRKLFRAIVDYARHLTPEAKVAISPFFILDREQVLGAFRYAEPDEYTAWWTETLRETGIDILMAQDAGEHASFSTPAQHRPFLAAYATACGNAGKAFWVNVETAELHVPDFAALKAARELPADQQPWRPVPLDRLKDKLALARSLSSQAVTWGWEYWRPALGGQAAAYYEEFRKLNRDSA